MGKTQFAFSLSTLIQGFYVNFSNIDEMQTVYKAFNGISSRFKRFLFKDCEKLNAMRLGLDSNELSSSEAFDIKLLTIGFIWNLVEHSMEYDPAKSEWFEYYLKPRKFQFKAMSIGEYLVNLSNFYHI